MQPESFDGFASVGTILPEGRAALLPGGSFRFCGLFLSFAAAGFYFACFFGIHVVGRFSPLFSAGFASPGVDWIDAFEQRVAGAAFWTGGRLVFGRIDLGFFDDFLRDRSGGNFDCGLKLVGRDHNPWIADAEEYREPGCSTQLSNPAWART